MVAARCLVVIIIILDEERRILRQRIDDPTAELVSAALQILETLCAHGRLLGIAGVLAVLGIEIALGVHTGHVVHGGGDRRLDAGVERGGVERHPAPAADADDADALRVDPLVQRQEIHRRHEVLGIDVGRGHIAGRAAALAGKGGVKGQRQKAAPGHRLGVEAGALLLDRAERPADRDRRELSRRPLRHIEIAGERDPIAVYKADLAVLNSLAFGEGLIPLLCQLQILGFDHVFSSLRAFRISRSSRSSCFCFS